MKGSEILLETLIDEGVDTIFGYPGGAVLNIYDSLYDYKDKITHILTSHEQGAAHAADGYARASGKTGVVLATSGPGATNLVTGIATAYMDSIPMVAITGNVSKNLIGKDSFQEIYIAGITLPITKHNFVVRDIKELEQTVRAAFAIANSGRKGPVLIDIPKDISVAEYEYKGKNSENKFLNTFNQKYNKFKEEDIKKVAGLIKNAKQPVIYCGGGIIASNAQESLKELMEKADIPACNTIMGIGSIDQNSPLYLGMVGMHGRLSTNKAIENSDLLIAVGVRFSDRVALNPQSFASNAHIIHIDIDASEAGKIVKTDTALIGDADTILKKINMYVDKKENNAWIKQVQKWQEDDFKPENGKDVLPHQIIENINEVFGESSIIVTDVGQHQMWAAQFCKERKPRTFITSGGLGTMGFGMGASMGAKVAKPEKNVILITGDGSFHMNMNEISTLTSHGIKVIAVVMNNQSLGMPRQWQHYLYEDRFSYSDFIRKTDYVKLAQALGAKGYSCSDMEAFKQALEQAVQNTETTVIECKINNNIQVLPMIPAGGTVKDVIME